MSYEVTATRRRPQKFDDLVGQEFVAETLKNSIKSGKIAHAYLFSGPRGCGKTSTARILAKALNCQHGPTDSPCGQCSNCQEITKGASLDVIEIDGASNTSVENIRQIKDEVLFPPSNSRYKIYIIDEVHMLSTSAFNALLKTIEEPPAYVIFIFATTELQKVPATIKSRCQQFNFRLVAIDKVKQCLAEAAAELNIQADDEALYWIARESTGSMRDSYTLFDQVVAFSDGHMTYEKIRDKLGLVGIDRLNTIFEACAQNQCEAVINLIDEFLQAGVSIEQMISNSADYLRSLLLIKNGVKKESLLGNSPERYSSTVLGAWNPIQIERALSLFLQLYRDIRYSLSPRYELELAFSRLCWIGQYVSNAEVKKAIDAAQGLLLGAQAQPVYSAPAPQQSYSPAPSNPTPSPAPAFEAASTADSFMPSQSDFDAASKIFDSAPSTASTPASSPLAADGLPEGLPRLRINTEKQDSNPDGDSPAPGEEPNPFSNGGSLPPEQSVTATATDNSYTENPDFNDDGWTNTDEPPVDDYYEESEEEAAERVEQTYNEFENQSNNVEAAPIQSDETFKAGNGQVMSIAQLRGNVMAALSVNNTFLANVISRTGKWEVTEEKVRTECQSEYDLNLIQKDILMLNQEISSVCGRPMIFSVTLEQKKEDNSAKELPKQVKILLSAFRGTLSGR